MEAVELAVLMFCICVAGTVLYSTSSPLERFTLSRIEKASLMGFAVAATTFLIMRSPFGRRSGAHFNPAITLSYLWLGLIHRWDAVFYIAAQFSGALIGVFTAREVLGFNLSDDPVRYVVTTPGIQGSVSAFVAELLLAALFMGMVLFATNHRRLARFSPLLLSAVTIFYFVACSSISGFSVNPARTFSSAFFASIWSGIWIYFAAPCLGMLSASVLYVSAVGPERVYCAKVFHDLYSTCPFRCRFERLNQED
jgi:aquaporin Z